MTAPALLAALRAANPDHDQDHFVDQPYTRDDADMRRAEQDRDRREEWLIQAGEDTPC